MTVMTHPSPSSSASTKHHNVTRPVRSSVRRVGSESAHVAMLVLDTQHPRRGRGRGPSCVCRLAETRPNNQHDTVSGPIKHLLKNRQLTDPQRRRPGRGRRSVARDRDRGQALDTGIRKGPPPWTEVASAGETGPTFTSRPCVMCWCVGVSGWVRFEVRGQVRSRRRLQVCPFV
jgi:hypothetical protein